MVLEVAKLAAALKKLERSDGKLLPEDVLKAAMSPRSPLHSYFTWDDSDAAHKQRLHEARQLIRTVRVDVIVRDVPIKVCGYVRDPEAAANEPGYRNIHTVRGEEYLSRAVIVDEMKRVIAAVNRAKRIALLLGVQQDVEAIDALAQKIVTNVSQQSI